MSRYLRIYREFLRSSLVRELEFKANFWAKVAQNFVWSFFFVLILAVIYGNTQSVAGWSRSDSFLLAATVFLLNAVSGAFFFSLVEIPSQVRMGTLDFVVTRPIDSQFWVSFRRFNYDQIGTLIAGIGMLVMAGATASQSIASVQWAAYFFLLLCACVIFYAFNLALMTTGIWLVRVDNLWVLSESVTNVSRYPIDIYNTGIQRLLTFFVPLAFLGTVPTNMLREPVNPYLLSVGAAWAVGSLVASRWFWRYAMRHYTSASS